MAPPPRRPIGSRTPAPAAEPACDDPTYDDLVRRYAARVAPAARRRALRRALAVLHREGLGDPRERLAAIEAALADQPPEDQTRALTRLVELAAERVGAADRRAAGPTAQCAPGTDGPPTRPAMFSQRLRGWLRRALSRARGAD